MDSLPTGRSNSLKGLALDVTDEPARASIERSQSIHRPQHQPTIFGIEPEPHERIRAKRNNDLPLENTKAHNLAIFGDRGVDKSTILSEQPSRRNILIFGDIGVGKSSLVNLIAGEDRAVTAGGAKTCTLQSQEYLVTFDGIEFALHDTIGLHEGCGNMRMGEYLDAVHQMYALVSTLEQLGGISLLVFCLRGGRISITMTHAYNLLVEVLCNRQVPIVIAVTHLEWFDNMEQWWRENEDVIERRYGLGSSGHACITTFRGYKGIFSDKYEESREIIRKLLVDFSGGVSSKEEKASWVKRHMRSWLPPPRRNQFDVGDMKRKLVKQCGFLIEDADLVAQKIEQSRGASEDMPGDEQSYEEFANDGRNVVKSGSLQELRSFKFAPSVVANGGEGDVKKSVAEDAPPQEPGSVKATRNIVADGPLLREPGNFKASPGVVLNGGEGVTKNVTEDAPVQELGNFNAAFDLVSGKEATRTSAADGTLPQEPSSVKSVLGVVPNRQMDASKKSLAPGGVAVPQPRNSKVIGKGGHKPGESREKANDRHSVAERVKLERRNTR